MKMYDLKLDAIDTGYVLYLSHLYPSSLQLCIVHAVEEEIKGHMSNETHLGSPWWQILEATSKITFHALHLDNHISWFLTYILDGFNHCVF